MKKRRYFLNSIFLYAFIFVGIVFLELNESIVPTTSFGTNQTMFYLLAGVSFALGIAYLILDGKKNGKLFEKNVIPALLLLFVGPLVTTITQTDQIFTYQYTATATFSVVDKVNYLLETFLGIFMIYIICYAYWKNRSNYRHMHIFLYAAIAACLFLITVSLCIEFPKYQHIFGVGSSEEPFKTICSVFSNENVYGITLTIGILALGFVRTLKKHWIQIVLFFVFYIELILTSSLTGIVVSTLFILFYFNYNVIRKMKTKFLPNLLLIAFSFLGVVTLIAWIYADYVFKIPPFYNLADFFFKEIINKNFATFSNRTIIWQDIGELCSDTPLHLIFGRGHSQGIYLLQMMSVAKYGLDVNLAYHAHNSILEVFLSFGLLGLALYAFILIYSIYCCIYMIRHGNKQLGVVLLVINILINLLGVAESIPFFKFSFTGIYVALAFLMPPIFYKQRSKHPVDVLNDKLYAYREVKTKFSLSPLFVYIFFGIVCAFIGTSISFKTYDSYVSLSFMIMAITLSVASLLFVPTLFKLFGMGSFRRLVVRSCLYPLLILGCAATPVVLYVLNILDKMTLMWMPVAAYSAALLIVIGIYSIVYKFNFVKSLFVELRALKIYPLICGLVALLISLGGNIALSFIDFPYVVWASFAVAGGAIGIYLFMLLLPNNFDCSQYLLQVNKGFLKFDVTEHYIEKYGWDYAKRE